MAFLFYGGRGKIKKKSGNQLIFPAQNLFYKEKKIMKHIVIITTGGTIAMKTDPETGGLVPAVSGEDLTAAVPLLSKYAEVETVEFSNVPSGYVTPSDMFCLSLLIDEMAGKEEIDGFVITHGTDTLEETAFFLDVTLKTKKPVCITGAMRGTSDPGSDGPANILGAVRTACTEEAGGMGVLVVLNDEIHAARYVTKTHTTNPGTFQSPGWGPIGRIYGDRIVFGYRLQEGVKAYPDQIVPNVWLVKSVSGMDETMIRLAAENYADGIVVEALGCGNVSPDERMGILYARSRGIPVVLTTRVPGGRVTEEYGYLGSASTMMDSGIILGGELSGPKARLLLIAALGVTRDNEQLRDFFDR